MRQCSTCGKVIFDIVYHTQNMLHVFCDAYCSNEWFVKNKDEVKENKLTVNSLDEYLRF